MGEEQARFLTATAESSQMKRQGRRAERFVRGGMGRPSGGGGGSLRFAPAGSRHARVTAFDPTGR